MNTAARTPGNATEAQVQSPAHACPRPSGRRRYDETGFGLPMLSDEIQEQAISDVINLYRLWQQRETTDDPQGTAFLGIGLLACALAENGVGSRGFEASEPVRAAQAACDLLYATEQIMAGFVGLYQERPRMPELDSLSAEVADKMTGLSAVLRKASATVGEILDVADRIQRFITTNPQRASSLVALYRWYDSADVLLYVGITRNLARRQDSHDARSSWAQFAVRSTVERHPNRAAAEAAERAAIEAERPLFNHVHNDTPEARQRLVGYLVKHGRTDLLAPAVSRG